VELKLAPSILTADFGRLAEEVDSVGPYVDWFHLDVMDGHYVENLTFGFSTIEAVSAATTKPLHVHLMIANPLPFIDRYARAGAARISFHPEAVEDVGEVVEAISGAGAGPGIAVHPDIDLAVIEDHLDALAVVLMMTVRPGFGGQSFMPEVLPKIEAAARMVKDRAAAAQIEVDGGVKLSNVADVVAAGAEILVAGSAIFDGIDAPAAAGGMRKVLDDLQEAG
jgi:ribulose-phosphate 3-epimerase